MTDQLQKKLSRRDAFKVLGAALGATVLANLPSKWSKPEVVSGVLPAHAQSTGALPTVVTNSITQTFSPLGAADFAGTVTSIGGSPILDRGFVWSAVSVTTNPTLANSSVSVGAGGTGAFTSIGTDAQPYFAPLNGRAYATNASGTAYGNVINFSTVICLAEGMLVRLADGSEKKIEDIEYSDLLLVWNFDEGRFDTAKPLWIKEAETTYRYNLLEFSDGSTLKTVNQHRIFNKEMGAFTYPMTEDTPVGTTTFNVNGEEITMISKRVVNEQIRYYNVMTHTHLNLFANGILTSCRYNNIYPIADMKFVKDDREVIPREVFTELDPEYYEGFRLGEQKIPVDAIIADLKIRDTVKLGKTKLVGENI